MSVGDDILAAVTAESTAVDSVIAFITGLRNQGTIDSTTAQAILDHISSDKAKLETAITANVVPPTTP